MGGELELTVALFQLLEVGVHLGGEVEEDQGKKRANFAKNYYYYYGGEEKGKSSPRSNKSQCFRAFSSDPGVDGH